MDIDRIIYVAGILEQRVPFKNEPFQPHSRTVKVFRKPSSWFGKATLLHPVAFRPSIRMIEMMGCISSSGSMLSYIWVTNEDVLVMQINGKHVFVENDSLTDEDITNLIIGTQGDAELLRGEYQKALDETLLELS